MRVTQSLLLGIAGSRLFSVPELPFGTVMATGGAGSVLGFFGFHNAKLAFAILALLQAVMLGGCWLFSSLKYRRAPRWRFGLFTVPLGLAVIGNDLAGFLHDTSMQIAGLAWAATFLLGVWRIALLCRQSGRHESVDGSWFLAPAALLGDAMATLAVFGTAQAWLFWLAVVACLGGVAIYLLVVALSARKLKRDGVGMRTATWWISAGCGGLAAASVADVARCFPDTHLMHSGLDGLLILTWALGSLLLIAVLAGCIRHFVHRRPGLWAVVWTPVFSMAVYAAGSHAMAQLVPVAELHLLAVITTAATVGLWAVNSVLFAWHGIDPMPPATVQ